MATQQVTRDLDPSQVVPGLNARFGLKQSKIKDLAEQIKKAGGLLQRIEVYPVDEGPDKGKFAISFGSYRKAAIDLLNTEGAMMKVPVVITPAPKGPTATLDMLNRNLMENLARQDLTLMDTAAAMKALDDAGEDKAKICAMFKRPGRKEPASYSWVNTTMSFLDLPKKVQTRLHEATLDWQAGADLVKIMKTRPDKLDEVLAKMDELREAAIKREKLDEEKYLASLKKADEAKSRMEQALQESQAKEQEYKTKLEAAQATVNQLKSDAAAKCKEYEDGITAALAAANASTDSETLKRPVELAKELQDYRKESERELAKAQKALTALVEKPKKEAEAALEKARVSQAESTAATAEADKAKEVAKVPKGGTAPKKVADKPASAADVKAAAKAVGADNGIKPLTRAEIMKVVDFLALPSGQGKAEVAVKAIALSLKSCFNSGLTDKQCYAAMLRTVEAAMKK